MLSIQCRKTFPGFALDVEANLDSTSTCVFGPSGCGKTTLMRMVAGLTTPDSGEIRMGDRVLFSSQGNVDIPPNHRHIAFVPQDVLLFPHLTVKKNLLYGFARTPRNNQRIIPADLIDLLSLAPILDKWPDQISGGEAQRAAIARALLTSPELLIMDEPMASLDDRMKAKILSYLRGIPSRFHVDLLYVSHSTFEVFSIAEQVLVMSEGRRISLGGIHEIFDQPSAYAAIVQQGILNVVRGVMVRPFSNHHLLLNCGGFLLDPGPVDGLHEGEGATARFGGRNVMLSVEKPLGLSARNVIPARLKRIATVGRYCLVHLDAGAEVISELTPKAVSELSLQAGQEVFWIVKSNSIVIDPIPEAG